MCLCVLCVKVCVMLYRLFVVSFCVNLCIENLCVCFVGDVLCDIVWFAFCVF